MSLILDALRKMELERKARRQGTQTLRADVLSYRGNAPDPDKSRVVLIAAGFLLACVTVAGIYYVAGTPAPQRDSEKRAESQQKEQSPVVQPSPPPEPAAVQNASETPRQKIDQQERVLVKEAQDAAVKVLKAAQKNGDAGITVSGIAWQDERSLRRAVINGALVGEGAEILGAKVVEIRENRVKFSRGGDIFEVSHSSPGQ